MHCPIPTRVAICTDRRFELRDELLEFSHGQRKGDTEVDADPAALQRRTRCRADPLGAGRRRNAEHVALHRNREALSGAAHRDRRSAENPVRRGEGEAYGAQEKTKGEVARGRPLAGPRLTAPARFDSAVLGRHRGSPPRRTDGQCESSLLALLAVDHPIVQAPMAGVSTPAMAAAVANAGALGSLSVGATDATLARTMIAAFRERSQRPLNVNVFCHSPATVNAAREAAWINGCGPSSSDSERRRRMRSRRSIEASSSTTTCSRR